MMFAYLYAILPHKTAHIFVCLNMQTELYIRAFGVGGAQRESVRFSFDANIIA